jgi:tRNA (guanine-N7-)-methyltransferase
MQTAAPVDLKPWFLTLADVESAYGDVLEWPEFFGSDNPVELDVGCGRGLHLVNAGLANPQVNYLGIETDYRKGRRGAERLKKLEMTNACVLGGDAVIVLSRLVRPHSVDAVHVYFPDPWWKRRHRRRRVFNERFIDLCAEVLKPGGLLHSWTDVEEYFGVISALMEHHPLFETLTPPPERTPGHDLDYQTSFERKKRKAGETIYRGRWRRSPVPSAGH